ncbi:MAG: hypothetical protein KGS45_00750 [Planctomycetes bacterium]|nr:hypothetical protein [Planctomycetota bacterium]
MIADLFSDWSPHLRALWNDPLVWIREHWTFVLLAIISIAAIGWWFLGLLTTDHGRFCPGPRPAGFLLWRRIIAALWPVNWVSHWSSLARCGYDLSHTPADHTGHQTCPECGTRSARSHQIPGTLSLAIRPTRWRRPVSLRSSLRPRIFRRDVVAGLTLLGCLILWKSPTYRHATFVRHLPDRAIISLCSALGHASPDHLESEFMTRVSDPALSAADAPHAIPVLISRLSDDSRQWNGWQASDTLCQLLSSPDAKISIAADTALDAALQHPDRQTRQFVAGVLRRHLAKLPGSTPSPRLLAVTVEGLDGDNLDERTGWLANAREGVTFLQTHAAASARFLHHKLSDSNPQGRWLAAVIIARASLTDLIPEAAPILIAQLRDNDTSGDERVAADALRHFGPAIIPLLTPHFESDDAQLRTWCGRLVRELREAEHGLVPAPILPHRYTLIYTPGVIVESRTKPVDANP